MEGLSNKAMFPAEFQAVIMAGGHGSTISPLTNDIPKPLLPVANRPLISYQLELLESLGFEEVIVVTNKKHTEEIKLYILGIYNFKLQIIWIELDEKEELGTVGALHRIKPYIRGDFIVMSCDFIANPNFIHRMAEIHRTMDTTMTMLLGVKREGKDPDEILLSDYIGLAPVMNSQDHRLIFIRPTADVDHQRGIRLSKDILRLFPNVNICTKLRDCHFYMFAQEVYTIMESLEITDADSIKADLVPRLIKKQFYNADREAYGKPRSIPAAYRLAGNYTGDADDNLVCMAHIADDFALRINTNFLYKDININACNANFPYKPFEKPAKYNAYVHEKVATEKSFTRISSSVVGETKVGDRCSIKNSCIGKHCIVEDNVKVVNSVIMNYVTIKAGCTIQNSVICDNAELNEKCLIKDTLIGKQYKVEKGTEVKFENLMLLFDSESEDHS